MHNSTVLGVGEKQKDQLILWLFNTRYIVRAKTLENCFEQTRDALCFKIVN